MTDRDPPFPRFSGKAEDWPSFKTKAKALLTYKHANILNAVPTDASQLATYQAASTWLFLQLILYVEGAAAEVVQPFDGNGAGAWLALHDKYEAVSIARQAQLQAEVTNATLKDDEDPDLHFLRLEESRRQLAAQGITLQDDFIRNVVLEHLPASYTAIQPILRVTAGLTYATLKDQVRAYYSTALRPHLSSGSTSSAMLAKRADICSYCQKPGHTRNVCRKRLAGTPPQQQDQPQQGVVCHKCRGVGHLRRDCPSKTEAEAHLAGINTLTNYAC